MLVAAQQPAKRHSPLEAASIGYLAGSPQYLAWSSQDGATLMAWRIGSRLVRSYSSPDDLHRFQFLELAEGFLLWYSGQTSSVLDLRTGGMFDVPLPGTVAGSPDWIATSVPGKPIKLQNR